MSVWIGVNEWRERESENECVDGWGSVYINEWVGVV